MSCQNGQLFSQRISAFLSNCGYVNGNICDNRGNFCQIYFSCVNTRPLNSTSAPSACSAICPLVAVQLYPLFTRSLFTHTLTESPTHSSFIEFHSPKGFSDPSVRFTTRRSLPSVIPQFSFGPLRFSISGTSMS